MIFRRRAAALAAVFWACWASAASEVDFQSVLVKPGDTLWSIAHRYLKDPAKWDEVLKYNRLPSSDPTVALPGMTLRVPVRLIKEDLRAAKLVYRVNKVLFRRKETADWKPTSDRMELFRNDSLRTLEDSKARVKFLSSDLLQLEPNSMAIIKPANKDYEVDLKRGGVYLGRAKIVTASAKITPKTHDTKYAATVRNDLSTLVEVYNGLAAVEAEGQTVDVPAGMATDVKMGLAPAVPIKIADLPDIDGRMAEFDGDFRAMRAKVAVSPEMRLSFSRGGTAKAADVGTLQGVIDLLKIGEPVSGYRVQFADSPNFAGILFDKSFDSDQQLKPSEVRLAPGRYWVRVIMVDLLGTEGKPSQPKLYNLTPSSLRPVAQDLKSKVTLVRPADGEVSLEPTLRVMGKVRDNVSVLVNGRSVRLDEDSNFSIVLPLTRGDNEIRVSIVDQDGNTDSIIRRATYRPKIDQ